MFEDIYNTSLFNCNNNPLKTYSAFSLELFILCFVPVENHTRNVISRVPIVNTLGHATISFYYMALYCLFFVSANYSALGLVVDGSRTYGSKSRSSRSETQRGSRSKR